MLQLNVKIERSEKELGKLNSLWRLSDLAEDQEILTDEERQKFRKIGLKMDEFLLLGTAVIIPNFIRLFSNSFLSASFLFIKFRLLAYLSIYSKYSSHINMVTYAGRRGVYDGTIASMHQHWKHRELVKVITMQNAFLQVSYTAKQLEIESGGILVAVRQLRKGHVIILYRGKNYRRPLKLLPDNLLTKREALKKSIEVQRRGVIQQTSFFFIFLLTKSGS